MDVSHYLAAYLKASDIPKPVVVVISGWAERILRDSHNGQDEKKVCISFSGCEREMVLNKSRMQFLVDNFGPDTDGWINKQVVVDTAPTNMGPGLVLRLPGDHVPQPQPQPPEPSQGGSQPF